MHICYNLLSLLFNCISVRLALQILFIKGDCTLLLLNFLAIALCDSSANSLLEMILFLIPLPDVFFSYQKIYRPLK